MEAGAHTNFTFVARKGEGALFEFVGGAVDFGAVMDEELGAIDVPTRCRLHQRRVPIFVEDFRVGARAQQIVNDVLKPATTCVHQRGVARRALLVNVLLSHVYYMCSHLLHNPTYTYIMWVYVPVRDQ